MKSPISSKTSLLLFIAATLPLFGEPSRDAADVHFQAGLDAAHKEQWPQAIKEFSTVIAARRDAASLCAAHINRGRARMLSGDLDGALADFDGALEASPNSAEALCWRASYWSEKGDKAKTIADCTKAIAFDPKCASAYVRRGTAFGSLKQYQRANEDYSIALNIEPNDVAALLGRGLAREQLLDMAGALADIDHALVLDPSLPRGKIVRDRVAAKLKGLTRR
jgi:tetratricopeptide (TPR) repeat protein